MSLSIRSRTGRRLGVLVTATALVGSGLTVLTTGTALAAATGGAGASLPYIELQAENAATNGTVIGPSSVYGTLPDEASYRKAVTLSGTGQYVEFTTTAPTNSIDVRYSIPDGSGGSVYTSPLSLSINGTAQSDFTLTDAYSWYYGAYPFTNTPGSNPHHFYDEVHRLLPTVYPAGTKFRLTVPSSATAATTTIDFADFENVAAPLTQPAGSVSVLSSGADATGVADSTAAFNAAIASAGAGGTVWIPTGTYDIPGHIIVNNVTVKGAGMWYSTVKGSAPGFYGGYAPNASSNVHLSDFAIFGDVQQRDDSAQVNGIGGALNSSTVSNIWIDHLKVGAWMDGPFDGLTFSGMRIRDTTADGINFHGGVTNSTVTNSDIRNTGDDGLATWADAAIGADAFDTFSNNTVQGRDPGQRHRDLRWPRQHRVGEPGRRLRPAAGRRHPRRAALRLHDAGQDDGQQQHADPRRQPRRQLAVRRRRAVVRRPGRLDVRACDRDEHADPAEPVRGHHVHRRHDQRRHDQQRDDPGHRHLRHPGAGARLGHGVRRRGDGRLAVTAGPSAAKAPTSS